MRGRIGDKNNKRKKTIKKIMKQIEMTKQNNKKQKWKNR